MGFGKIIKRVAAYGLKRKTVKKLRRKIGLTSDSKFMRQLKRSISRKPKSVVAGAPTSASALDSNYQYRPRTISQLMGGN